MARASTTAAPRSRSKPAEAPAAAAKSDSAPKVNGHPQAAEPSITEADIFELMENLPDGDWDRHKLYLYRLWPRIDRGGDNHYIGVMQEPVNQERLLQTYGSGRYMLWLKSTRPSKSIAKQTVALHRDDCPPKLDPSHVLADDPANERYFQTWGRPQQAQHTPTAPQGNNDATQELASIVRGLTNRGTEIDSAQQQILMNAANQAIEMIKAQAAGGGSSNLEMMEMVLRLKDALQPTSHGSDALVQLLISQQQASSQQQAQSQELLLSLLKNARAESGGLGNIHETLEILRALKEFGSAPETPWWKDAIDSAPKLLEPASSILESVAALRGAALPGTRTAAQSSGRAPRSASGTTQVSQSAELASTTAQEASGRAASTAEDSPEAISDANVDRLVEEFAPLILNNLMTGGHGGAMAENMEGLYGPTPIDNVVAIGKERVLRAIRDHPRLWPVFQPHESRLTAFVGEFFEYAERPEHPESGDTSYRQEGRSAQASPTE